VPSHVSLGSLYCGMLHSMGVRSLGAQTPRPAQAPQPARTITLSKPMQPPPSSGLGSVTPSTIEIARLRLADARAQIDSNEVEIHKKFAIAVACFVFVMLGAPIALRFPRGGVGLTIGASLFVFALYYIGLTAGASLATQGLLPPWVAMWAADAIFFVVALYLMRKMGTEGTTSRGGEMGETIDRLRLWLRARRHRLGLARERRGERNVDRSAA
jgi:lipopolysaccharide export system permease protein